MLKPQKQAHIKLITCKLEIAIKYTEKDKKSTQNTTTGSKKEKNPYNQRKTDNASPAEAYVWNDKSRTTIKKLIAGCGGESKTTKTQSNENKKYRNIDQRENPQSFYFEVPETSLH